MSRLSPLGLNRADVVARHAYTCITDYVLNIAVDAIKNINIVYRRCFSSTLHHEATHFISKQVYLLTPMDVRRWLTQNRPYRTAHRV